jgi:hypothetical protein
MDRKKFISSLAAGAATTVVGAGTAFGNTATSSIPSGSLNMAPTHKVKRGVALYSYQQTMMLNGMTLAKMLEECASIGAYGIEAIGQVFIKDYPNPTDKWIGEWWDLLDRYGIKPVSYTNFHDNQLQRRPMRLPEMLEYQTREFHLARKMGLTKIRMLNGTTTDLLEAAIPVAEKLGVWMGVEIHSPTKLDSKFVAWIVQKAEKHPEAIGLYPDMGIFTKYPRPYARDRQIKAGTLTREIALYIEDSHKKGLDKAEVANKVKGMKPKPGDTSYVDQVYRNSPENPKDIVPLLKYCKAIHGKFWEMSKGSEYYDTQIIYDQAVPVLMAGGYDGYILSEYEGQRSMEVADVNEIDEVRRQHFMLKKILGV